MSPEIRRQRRRAQRDADGTSQWITSEAARADVHRRRAVADAIIVGTGTVIVDDPATARRPDGSLADRQPMRVVVGEREISSRRSSQ
jgi:diaminohydroxyphosphoribosylaminopyrimidine deaminase/5-amino-6-(5-phosphoribosylamino)uracil reductase